LFLFLFSLFLFNLISDYFPFSGHVLPIDL